MLQCGRRRLYTPIWMIVFLFLSIPSCSSFLFFSFFGRRGLLWDEEDDQRRMPNQLAFLKIQFPPPFSVYFFYFFFFLFFRNASSSNGDVVWCPRHFVCRISPTGRWIRSIHQSRGVAVKQISTHCKKFNLILNQNLIQNDMQFITRDLLFLWKIKYC